MHIKAAWVDTILGITFIALALTFLLAVNPFSIELPTATYQENTSAINPAYFPNMICWLMLVFSACLTVSGLRELKKEASGSSSLVEFDMDARAMLVRIGAMVTLILIYFVAELSGILIAGFIFYLLFSFFTGEKKYVRAVMGSIITTVTLYYFFVHIGQVPLPLGPLANFL